MQNPKIDGKLEKKLKYLTKIELDSSENPNFQIPIKIRPYREYKQTGVVEVTFAPNKPVKATKEKIFSSGFQAVIDELEKLKIEYTPFIESRYIIANLNASQIKTFASKPYIEEIQDDSPII